MNGIPLNGGEMDDRDERLTYTVPEVARLLGLSRGAAYAAVNAREIPSLRIGRRTLVPRVGLERILGQVGLKQDGG
jgi:excisionase family DNA binding protein